MTKIISELLGASEPLFSINLEHLERACGRPNIDIRLTAEILSKTRQKLSELGLDPHDTTEHELYYGLENLISIHDRFLAHSLGGTDPDDVADMMPRILHRVQALDIAKHGWFMKHSVAKRLLKATPPKKVMKTLGYRSIDSMLKRESAGPLYAAMRFLESDQWLAGFMSKYDKLKPSDFEVRDIEIIELENKRWASAAATMMQQKHHNVMQVRELGTVLLLPLPVSRRAGVTITVMLMLLDALNEIRLYSAHAKLQQVRPDFGKRLAVGLLNDYGYHAVVAGHAIHWRVMQRHYGRLPATSHPETFEPHVQAEDLSWRKAEEVLYRLEPALHFWHDLDYVAMRGHDGKPISFNLMDAALNYVNQLPFDKRVYAHAISGLWNELYGRYVEQPAVKEQILRQFDGTVLENDVWTSALQGKEA